MNIKLAAALFAFLVLVLWMSDASPQQSVAQSPDRIDLDAATGGAEPEAITDESEQRPFPGTTIEGLELGRVTIPEATPRDLVNGPGFIAEPEDPRKVQFIAEPQDPNEVCFILVAAGPIHVCDLLEARLPESPLGDELVP